jgi:alpha-beta hydrolase superfamily lysophospholipase
MRRRILLGCLAERAGLDADLFMAINAAFAPTRTDFDWLSRDPEDVDRYVADLLCGFTVADASLAAMGADSLALSEPDATARVRNDLPIYVFSGDRDPVGADGKGVELVATRCREAGVEDVGLCLYPDARHELLNETNQDEVTEYFLAWAGRFLRAFGE